MNIELKLLYVCLLKYGHKVCDMIYDGNVCALYTESSHKQWIPTMMSRNGCQIKTLTKYASFILRPAGK